MAPITQRWTIGHTRLTTVVEAETPAPPAMLIPEATADDIRSATWLSDDMASDGGKLMGFRVQAFILEHHDEVVVVDPCVGNHKELELPIWNQLDLPWLADFRAAGFDPATVTRVIHTHLHEDHIGWDTHLVDGVWVPTFPNAVHVYVGDELDYTKRPDRRVGQDPWADSIQPILDAGLALETAADADLGNGLQLLATIGHTPGHTALMVDTGSDPLVITGDVIFHPFQCAVPHLDHRSDWKPALARETRRAFLDQQARQGAVVAGTHFPATPVGVIQPHGDAWKFNVTDCDAP